MTFPKKLSVEQERRLLVDYQDGLTIKELTVAHRVSSRTIFRTLTHYGIPRVRRRRVLRRDQRPWRDAKEKELMPCGTNAGYARHNKAGEPPCIACCDAHAVDQKRWREKRKIKARDENMDCNDINTTNQE